MKQRGLRFLAFFCSLMMALVMIVPAFAVEDSAAQPDNYEMPVEIETAGMNAAIIQETQNAMSAEGFQKGTEYGSDYSWKVDSNGTLTIAGTEMPSWDTQNMPPWFITKYPIQSIVIEEGMTNIGSFAFFTCSDLISAYIPSSVERIGSCAFFSLSKLINVEMQYGVRWIGESAFADCKTLENISLPDSVTLIGKGAFQGSAIKTIKLSNQLESIGENAFFLCSRLQSIAFPASLQFIREGAFMACSALAGRVEIPDTVTGIGEAAFASCNKVTDITLGSGVKTIGDLAFSNCDSLQKIQFAGDAPEFEKGNNGEPKQFQGVQATVCYPSDNRTWTESKRKNYGGLLMWTPYGSTAPGTVNVTGISLNKTSADVVIGEQLTLTATVVPSNASNQTVTWESSNTAVVTVNNGVVTAVAAGNAAIMAITADGGKKAVCAVNVAEKEEQDDTDVTGFTQGTETGSDYWWKLESDGTLIIKGTRMPGWSNDGAPWDSSKVTKAVVRPGITNIGNYAFYGCSKMTEVSLPSSVTRIGESSFAVCSRLKSIELPAKVKTIGQFAFRLCRGLENIDFSRELVSIGAFAFADCDSLSVALLPSSVTTIEKFAFSGCSGLMSVTLPGKLTTIDAMLFTRCTNLSHIVIPQGVKTIGHDAFAGCSNLMDISIPASVTTIDTGAFGNCTVLSEIRFAGKAPQFKDVTQEYEHFKGVTATVYYPQNESSWSSVTRNNYGGTLTWVPYDKVEVTGITLNRTEAKLEQGEKARLTVDVSPANASNKDVIWTSSNTGIAVVIDGVVTAKKVGTAVITAVTQSENCEVFCVVTVQGKTWAPGDVNHDGKVSVTDLAIIKRHIMGRFPDIDMAAADVTGDGKITVRDLAKIKQLIMGKITTLE